MLGLKQCLNPHRNERNGSSEDGKPQHQRRPDLPDVQDHRETPRAFRFHIVIRGVVWDVTVQEPLPRPPRFPDHVPTLAGPHIDGVREIASGWRKRRAIQGDDFKGSSVNVHGVHEIVVRSDKTELHCLTHCHADNIG